MLFLTATTTTTTNKTTNHIVLLFITTLFTYMARVVVDPESNQGTLAMRQNFTLNATHVHSRAPCTHTFSQLFTLILT